MAYDETLAQRIRWHLERQPGMVEKKMFGGIGFLINGNMACGVNRDNLIVRLDPDRSEALLARPHTRVFDMTGKPMKGWVVVEPEGLQSEEQFRNWIDEGVAFAQTLPAK